MHLLFSNFDKEEYKHIFIFDAQFIGKFCLEHTLYCYDTKQLFHSQGSIDGKQEFDKLSAANLKQVHLPLNCDITRKPNDIFFNLKDIKKDEKVLIIFRGKIKMDYFKEKLAEFMGVTED